MTFLYEYLMFLGQVVTLVIGFIVVISFLASLNKGGGSDAQGHLQVQKLTTQPMSGALRSCRAADPSATSSKP